MKREQIIVRINSELKAKATIKAEKDYMNLSEYIRRLISDDLKKGK